MTENVNLDALLRAALADDSIPNVYFNGFVTTLGTGDVLAVLRLHDKPLMKLQMSYTVAKTLAEKLGGLIARLEKQTGRMIMTTDDIGAALARSEEESDGEHR